MALDKARPDDLIAQAIENQKNFVTDNELKDAATSAASNAVQTAVAQLAEAIDKIEQLLANGKVEEAQKVIPDLKNDPRTVVTGDTTGTTGDAGTTADAQG